MKLEESHPTCTTQSETPVSLTATSSKETFVWSAREGFEHGVYVFDKRGYEDNRILGDIPAHFLTNTSIGRENYLSHHSFFCFISWLLFLLCFF